MNVEDRTRALVARVSSLAASAGDAAGRRMPNSEWTIADTAAHLHVVAREFAAMFRGASSPIADMTEVAAYNQRALTEIPSADPAARAQEMSGQFADALAAYREGDPDRLINWHAGIKLPARLGLTMALGELVVHGLDMAQALGQPWPIDADDAAAIVAVGLRVAPALLDKDKARGVRGTVEVRLRGEGRPRMRMVLDDGDVAVLDSGFTGRADCVVSADPVAMLLQSYGRGSKWKPIVTGKMVAYGRKPWLAMQMQNLFRAP